jgi:hypothetical protein
LLLLLLLSSNHELPQLAICHLTLIQVQTIQRTGELERRAREGGFVHCRTTTTTTTSDRSYIDSSGHCGVTSDAAWVRAQFSHAARPCAQERLCAAQVPSSAQDVAQAQSPLDGERVLSPQLHSERGGMRGSGSLQDTSLRFAVTIVVFFLSILIGIIVTITIITTIIITILIITIITTTHTIIIITTMSFFTSRRPKPAPLRLLLTLVHGFKPVVHGRRVPASHDAKTRGALVSGKPGNPGLATEAGSNTTRAVAPDAQLA